MALANLHKARMKFPDDVQPIFTLVVPTPVAYRVVVDPLRPKLKSAGGIVFDRTTVEAERASTTIGKLVAVGDLAFKAKTPGLDFSQDTNIPKVGDWVVFAKHAGQPLRVRTSENESADSDDQRILLMLSDTDILAKLKNEEVSSFWHWVK